jgi:GSCFA family
LFDYCIAAWMTNQLLMSMDNPLPAPVWRGQKGDLDFEKPDRWFKGEFCNPFPTNRAIHPSDILLGWSASIPLVTRQSKVIAFGSCFAEYFIRFLAAHGYNDWTAPSERYALSEENLLLSLGQTFENVFVIVQQFRWAFGEFTPKPGTWITKDKVCFEANEERRLKVRSTLSQADIVVITLGLSEVWFDQVENEPLWRPMPERLYEPKRHVFRLASVAETEQALLELDRLVQQHCRKLKIIFTVSPIPLLATFRNQSSITANQVSKSILRVGLDTFLAKASSITAGRYFYFPSYELVFSLFGNPFEADNRHVRTEVADTILNIFRTAYTDIPGDNSVSPVVAPEEALRTQIRGLKEEIQSKENVIQELRQAAEERLAMIRRLEDSAVKRV